MTQAEKEKDAKKELLKNLFAADEMIVLDALEKAKFIGDAEAVAPILALVAKDDWPQAQEKAATVLSTLKDSEAQNTFLNHFDEAQYASATPTLLAAIWTAGMDASDHMAKVVKASLQSNYQAVLEALTILDNLENTIPEEQLMEAQLACKTYLEQNKNSDKKEMVTLLLQTLETTDSYE